MSKTQIEFSGNPDLNLTVKMKPMHFDFACQGALALAVGDVRLQFDEIPLFLRIPFLKRRVLAGSVGPFGVHLKPFEAQVRATEMETHGVIAREGSEFDLHGKGGCTAEIEISGDLPASNTKKR
jgi:hypothetical protein